MHEYYMHTQLILQNFVILILVQSIPCHSVSYFKIYSHVSDITITQCPDLMSLAVQIAVQYSTVQPMSLISPLLGAQIWALSDGDIRNWHGCKSNLD